MERKPQPVAFHHPFAWNSSQPFLVEIPNLYWNHKHIKKKQPNCSSKSTMMEDNKITFTHLIYLHAVATNFFFGASQATNTRFDLLSTHHYHHYIYKLESAIVGGFHREMFHFHPKTLQRPRSLIRPGVRLLPPSPPSSYAPEDDDDDERLYRWIISRKGLCLFSKNSFVSCLALYYTIIKPKTHWHAFLIGDYCVKMLLIPFTWMECEQLNEKDPEDTLRHVMCICDDVKTIFFLYQMILC